MNSDQNNNIYLKLEDSIKQDIESSFRDADFSSSESVIEAVVNLYKKEKTKSLLLEHRITEATLKNENYSRELATASNQVKENQVALAAANHQLRKFVVDLKTTISNLNEAYSDTINRLVSATEYKDRDTGSHIKRIGCYSALLAKKMGMDPEEVSTIGLASQMHDIGKIGIPDRILLKNGKLLEPELEMMRLHTIIGSNILADSKARVLQYAQQIALYHHEKWNGQGYPNCSMKEDIPLPARIVTLADTFDALVSKRPYKEAFSVEASCEIIRYESGRHFDPDLVELFFENFNDILAIYSQTPDKTPS